MTGTELASGHLGSLSHLLILLGSGSLRRISKCSRAPSVDWTASCQRVQSRQKCYVAIPAEQTLKHNIHRCDQLYPSSSQLCGEGSPLQTRASWTPVVATGLKRRMKEPPCPKREWSPLTTEWHFDRLPMLGRQCVVERLVRLISLCGDICFLREKCLPYFK